MIYELQNSKEFKYTTDSLTIEKNNFNTKDNQFK